MTVTFFVCTHISYNKKPSVVVTVVLTTEDIVIGQTIVTMKRLIQIYDKKQHDKKNKLFFFK